MITGAQFIEHLYPQGYIIKEQREFGIVESIKKVTLPILKPKVYKTKRAEYFLGKAKESKSLMDKANLDSFNNKILVDNKPTRLGNSIKEEILSDDRILLSPNSGWGRMREGVLGEKNVPLGSYLTNIKHGEGRKYKKIDISSLSPDTPEETISILKSLKQKDGVINMPYPDVTGRAYPTVLHEYGHHISQNRSLLSGNISRLHRVIGRVKKGEQNLISWLGRRKRKPEEIQTPRLDSALDWLGLEEEKNAWRKGANILRKHNPTQEELDYFNRNRNLAIESYKRGNEVRKYGRKYNKYRDKSSPKASEILGQHRSPWGTHNYELPPNNIKKNKKK